GQHHAEHLLEGEKVDATPPRFEVVAGAVPLTGIEAHVVGVVVAAERERNAIDRDSIELAGVAIRLLDLADQGAVHLARPSRPLAGRWRPPSGPAPTERGGRSPSLHPEPPLRPSQHRFSAGVRASTAGPLGRTKRVTKSRGNYSSCGPCHRVVR